MKLTDVMHEKVEVIAGDATIRDAARKMSELDVGSLPVCVNDRIVGFVTDRDIVVRSLAAGDSPDEARVSDVMTKGVKWCFDDESVEEATRKMSECQIQRLLVMNRDKRLVGIVSLADLVRDHEDSPAVTHAVEQIKAPTKSSAVGATAQAIAH